MGFASPLVLGLAALGALLIAGLHLLSVRTPPDLFLPTARFLPVSNVRAVSRTKTPSDLLLLLLRIAGVMAAGIALAGPRRTVATNSRLAVVVMEGGIAFDSAAIRRLLGADPVVAGAVLKISESPQAGAVDDGEAFEPAAVFPRAVQEAARAVQSAPRLDSVALIVLRASGAEPDSAWMAWRAAWPGQVIRYGPHVDTARAGGPQTRAASVARRVVIVPLASDTSHRDDVVLASMTWHAARVNAAPARANTSTTATMPAGTVGTVVDTVVVSRATRPSVPDDSVRAARVFVHWPVNGSPIDEGRTVSAPASVRAPTGTVWQPARTGDSSGALVASGRALMGPWPVTAFLTAWGPNNADTLSRRLQPVAWWSDGRVAAVEQRSPEVCARTVAVKVEQGGDVLLSPSANGLFDRLLAPCTSNELLPVASLGARVVSGAALAAASAFRGQSTTGAGRPPGRSLLERWAPPVLLGLALVALLIEWRLRRPMIVRAA